MASKMRVRIFAGPNGSGKSSLSRGFQQEIRKKTGFFVNADEIKLKLNQSSLIDLQLLGLSATLSTLDEFIKTGSHRMIIPTDAAQVLVDKYFIHNHGTYKRT